MQKNPGDRKGLHITAEQVFHVLRQSCPTVVPATVYNNLNLLCCEGHIRRITAAGMPGRYGRIVRHAQMEVQRLRICL